MFMPARTFLSDLQIIKTCRIKIIARGGSYLFRLLPQEFPI